jgi:hypothetical protein
MSLFDFESPALSAGEEYRPSEDVLPGQSIIAVLGPANRHGKSCFNFS